jgi:ribonuclease R
MNFKQKIEESIIEMRLSSFTDKMLFKKLNMYTNFEKGEVSRILRELVKDGLLIEQNKGKYFVAAKSEAIKGVIRGNKKGFAFLAREDGGADLFIPHKGLKDAQHGDTVYVRKVPKTADEAEVVSVVTRGYTQLVGTFSRQGGGYGFVVPEDQSYYSDIFVPAESTKKAQDNFKVIVKIVDFRAGKNPVGEIVEVLGRDGTVAGDTIAIVRSHGFKENFTEAQLKEAERVSKADISAQYGRREDYRNLKTITIDGNDARDFDDAVSIEKTENGYTLYVHIADVSNYITAGSILDDEALERATSVYLPNMVLPMLPEAISNGCCSLVEAEDRLTLTAVMYVIKAER